MACYAALSGLMSEHPEVFAIRLFSKLHVKSLLYYQAELAELEKELDEVETEDRACPEEPRKCFGQHWKSLTGTGISALEVGKETDPQDLRSRLQWDLVVRIRETLKEYDEAILRYDGICSSTRPPKSQSMKRLREWLQTPEFGDSFVSGKTEGVWDSAKNFNDFAVPHGGTGAVDGLTFQFASLFLYFESWVRWGRQPYDELHSLSSRATTKLSRAIVTTVSSTMPIIPIIILFFINRLLIRLGLVLLFTVLFAFVLVFGLSIESDKTLAVTTAFAAIQVVFVGSANGRLDGTSKTHD